MLTATKKEKEWADQLLFSACDTSYLTFINKNGDLKASQSQVKLWVIWSLENHALQARKSPWKGLDTNILS